MWPVRNTLLIARRDGTWLLLQGSSPDDGTMTELGQYRVPEPGLSGVILDNQLWYLSKRGRGLNSATPGSVDTETMEHIQPTRNPQATTNPPTQQNLRPVVDTDNRFLFLPARYTRGATQTTVAATEFINGVYTTSHWATPATTDSEGLDFTGGINGRLYAGFRDSTDWEFYCRDFTLNRPARTTGEDWSVSAVTEGYTTAYATFPEIKAGAGTQIRPVRLVIELDYWNAANFDPPLIDATINVLGVAGSAASEVSVTWAADVGTSAEGEPAWTTSTGVLPLRRTVQHYFTPGVWGSSISVALNFNSIAIRRMIVEYEERPLPRVA